MFFDIDLLKHDFKIYKFWFKSKTTQFDYLLFGILYLGGAIFFTLGTLKVNAALIDAMFGPFMSLLWTFSFIPVPWIAEQTNINRFKNTDPKKIKIILRTRLLEQFILIECFQAFFLVLALIGNYFHANAIVGYNFNYLPEQIIVIFLLMIGFEWFFLVLVTFLGFYNMNYLKFVYFDLIPRKKPFNITGSDYNIVFSKLKRPYQFKLRPLELMAVLLTIMTIIYCIPVTIYLMIIGNIPSLNSLPAPNDVLNVMHYTPYLLVIENLFFIVVGLFIWYKLPHTLQTIPEKLYSIPPEYLDILLRLDPRNRTIIANLQSGIN